MDLFTRNFKKKLKKREDPVTEIIGDGPPMWFLLFVCAVASLGLTAVIYLAAISISM